MVTGESSIDFRLMVHPLAFYDKVCTSELTFTSHESIIYLFVLELVMGETGGGDAICQSIIFDDKCL